MPEVLFPAQQRIRSHAEGLASMRSIGPTVNNDFWYMTRLYRSYAQSFVAFMNSELTITGRCNGFRPLFVMTNTNVQQKCHWGRVNRTRLTSMDNGAVSFLSCWWSFIQTAIIDSGHLRKIRPSKSVFSNRFRCDNFFSGFQRSGIRYDF